MSTTTRISSAVSKRKIAKSRLTRRPTSGDSGPNSCAALSILPNSGPTKPMPISMASAQPTTAKMIQKWFQPIPDFSTSATPKPNTKNSAGV